MNPHLNLFQSIGAALFGLTIVIVVGWYAIARIRAWMRPSEEPAEGFSLADLRKLHREGKLTDEEYERAHATMIAAVRNKPSRKEILPRKEPAPPVVGKRADEAPAQQPRVRGLADGRLIIRDDLPEAGGERPTPPPRPTNPADPRTGHDG